MNTPINYPCVMLEKQNTIGINISEQTLTNKFYLINSEEDFKIKSKHFENPVICHYYSVVNEAVRISKQLNELQTEGETSQN